MPERFHISSLIVHGAAERFRFAIPAGFEVTDVNSPLVARWVVEQEGERQLLNVQLREPAEGDVLLNVSAIRTAARLREWSFPSLEPLDVAGRAAMQAWLDHYATGDPAITEVVLFVRRLEEGPR